MGLVVRPPKTAGTNQYQTEVAAGAKAILDTEVDADFNVLYTLLTGHVSDANLDPNAAIAYEKLALRGKIQATDLASSPPFQLPPGVVLPPLTVDKTMIKVNGTWWAFQVHNTTGGAIGPTEVVLSELTFASRGAVCAVVGALAGNTVQTAAGSANYEVNLWMDGNPAVPDGSQIAHAVATMGLVGFSFTSGAELFQPLSTTLIGWNFGVPGFSPGVASNHRVKLSAKLTPSAGAISGGISYATIYLLELA